MVTCISLDFLLPQYHGPTLIALPGTGCNPVIYGGVHVDGWNLLSVDWARSKGPIDPLSVALRVKAALKNFTGPVVLLGHSTGAAIAALVASMAAESTPIAGLVMSNTGVHSRNHGDPTFAQRILECWSADEQEAFLRACFFYPPQAMLWKSMCSYLASMPASALLEAVQGLRALDLGLYLRRIRQPTLVAHGYYDKRRQVTDAQDLVADIPNARLAMLPGGHTPMVDCTANYCSVLKDFLGLVPVARRHLPDTLVTH